MEIKELFQTIKNEISAGTLILTDDENTARVFSGFVWQCAKWDFPLKNAQIIFDGIIIGLTGTAEFPPLSGEFVFAGQIIKNNRKINDDDPEFLFSMSAAAKTNGKAGDFFGYISPLLVRNDDDNTVLEYRDVLGDTEISDFVLTYTDAEDFAEDNFSFKFSCKMKLSGEKYFNSDNFWKIIKAASGNSLTSSAAFESEGRISFLQSGGSLSFYAKITLGSINLDRYFTGKTVPKNVTAFLHIQNTADGSETAAVSGGLTLSLLINGKEKEFTLASNILSGEHYLNFSAGFKNEGLTFSDGIDFLGSLFAVSENASKYLHIPPDSFINKIALKSLTLGYRLDEMKFNLWAAGCRVGLNSPWTFPIAQIVCKRLDIDFMGQWASIGQLITGDISAEFEITLSAVHTLTFSAEASLPDLEFTGSIQLLKDEDKKLSTVLGTDAAASLPVSISLQDSTNENEIARIDVIAGFTARYLSLSAEVNNVFSFGFGGGTLTFGLENVSAGAEFSQTGNTFSLSGIFSLSLSEDDAKKLTLAVTAICRTISSNVNVALLWDFSGNLKNPDNITFGDIISKLIGGAAKGGNFDFALTNFSIRYQYQKERDINPLALTAEFAGEWDLSFLSTELTLENGGQIAFSTAENGNITAAAMLYFKNNIFDLTALAQYAKTELKTAFSYIFELTFGGKGLRAGYYSETFAEKENKYLKGSLVNITLGDLADMFIKLINPNFKAGNLPAPLDSLYKIDLSKIIFTYNLTDKAVSADLEVNLNLLIVTVNSVGLSYNIKDGSDVNFTLKYTQIGDGENAGEETSWGLINGRPPSFGGADEKTPFKLNFLIIAERFNTADEAFSEQKAVSISSVFDALETDKTLSKYDTDIHFVLCADFTIAEDFSCKLAVIDPNIYGARITISENAENSLLKTFAGFFAEFFYKRISDKLGVLKVSVMMPTAFRKFILGPVTVTLGLLQGEIYTDGGFTVDLGFPHGGDFTNSFEFAFGIFLGRGGVYFGIMSGASQPSLPGEKAWGTVVAIGVGVTFGVGRSIDLGIVKAGFELSMTAIFEGLLAFAKNDQSGCITANQLATLNTQSNSDTDIYYKIYAKIGITGKLYISVDLFIIKLEASVLISASADVTAETGKAVIINLDFNLTLRGSVKILFFKVNFSYNFSYTARFEIAGDDSIKRLRSFHGTLPTENRNGGEKLSIPLYFDYSFTKANDGGKIVFVPSVNFSDAQKLIKLMSERVLDLLLGDKSDLAFDDVIFLDETQFADDNITYSIIENLLENNAEIIITDTPTTANPETAGIGAGVIIPIPPPCIFIFEDKKTSEKITTDYLDNIKINNEYSELLEKYFEKFSITKDSKKQANLFQEAPKPIAEILFTAFFRLISRQVLMLTKSLYKNFSIDVFEGSFIDFGSLSENFAVTASDIVIENGTLTLSGADFSPSGIIYSLRDNTSINELSSTYGISADIVYTQLKTKYILADTKITVAAFSFQAGNLKPENAAGFFFSRVYSERITAVWQRIYPDVVAALAGFESLSGNAKYTEKYRHREAALPISVNITLPDFDEPFEWYIQTGDNAETIAKTIAIICYGKSAYEYDADTDALFEDFKTKISGTEIISVPQMQNVIVYSSETPEMFSERIFASKTLTDQMKITAFGSLILARFANITIENPVFKTIQGMKLSEFTAKIPANLKTFAGDFTPAHFASGQTIQTNPMSLSKNILTEKITDETFISAVASFLSRVYSQGLRLPDLESTEKSFSLTPFFKLLRLQLDCTEGFAYSFSFAAKTQAQSWLSGKTESSLTAGSIDFHDWTEKTQVKALEFPFVKQPKAYAASRSFTVKAGDVSFAVYKFPSGMIITDGITLTVGNTVTAFKKALITQIDVTAVTETVLTLNNISASDRDKLGQIAQTVLNNPSANITFQILFEPSAKSGISDVFMDTGFGSTEKLIKTNLSRITKLAPEINQITEERYTVCDLSSADFLIMLWECAVTCGSYQLHISDKNKLPSDIFDNKNGKIYLFVYGGLPISACNCTAAEGIAAIAAGVFNLSEIESEFTPTIPPGCTEIDIKYTPTDPDSVFQIISYELSDVADSESKPLFPLDKSVSSVFEQEADNTDNTEMLYYAPVIPIYSILGETSPYTRFKNCEVNIRMRDIFGNVADGAKTLTLSFAYNDLLSDINEYPGIQVRYDIEKTSAAVLIKFIPSDKISEAEAERLQAIIFQLEDLRDNGGMVAVNSNILNPEIKITADFLVTFMKSVLDGTATEQIFSFTPLINAAQNIFIPSVSISLKRPGEELAGSDIPERVYSVSCNIMPGAQSAEVFAADFEAVFPEIKLAYKNASSRLYYAVKTTDAIGQITLSKPEKYYAIPPVANEPISADVAFTAGNTPVTVHYSEADLNLFFTRFADDFEENILSDFSAISKTDTDTLRKLINAKATLAGKIAKTVTAVFDDGTEIPPSEYLKNYLKNLCLEKINAGISSAASYSVSGNNGTVRINTSLKTKPDGITNAAINSSKIDLSNEFIIFYTAAKKYENIPKPQFDSIIVREFETNVTEQIDGYESSDWYQFIIPLSVAAPGVSQNEIPNPLKEIPLPPIPSNPCFYPPADCDPIYSTKYSFEIEAKAIAQDDINIAVTFTPTGETATPGNDFVNALGKYIYLRDEILKTGNIELFTECAVAIADSFEIVSGKQSKLAEKMFCCTARVDFQSGSVVIYNATPGFGYTVIQPETITAGKNFTFGLELAGLSVYEIQSASASVNITRNSRLTAPFIFKTDEKSLPAIFPCNKLSKRTIGTVDFVEEDFKTGDILKKLTDALAGSSAIESFEVVFTCFYSYEIMSDMPVAIPIIMIKSKLSELYSENRFTQIADKMTEKLNLLKPIVSNSAITFKLAVYNGETLVIAAELEVSGQT
ncbi:MAG: hypothetical protein LBM87_00275 [Ruminococcus sp.]|jgi:hypothetical protein|nr:hypothetical protein [Ruminococcus sp.]